MPQLAKLSEKLSWNYSTYVLGFMVLGFSYWPAGISKLYTPYVFKPFSNLLRLLLGKIQLPLGEFVYLMIVIILIFNIIRWLYHNRSSFNTLLFWKHQVLRWLNGLVKIYIVFELVWGLNYQKLNPSTDFKLQIPLAYTENQMDSLSLSLINQLNTTRAKMSVFDAKIINFDTVLSQIRVEFAKNARNRPFLKYRNGSLKKAIFPIWGDYFGYTAFYQPLTGEAIMRGDLPKLTWPFTMSHEIAHQLGYASEDQANFIAFVIGVESDQPLLNYSTQLQLFTYAQFAHLNFIAKRGDFQLYKHVIERNKSLLSTQVLADRMEIKKFFLQKQDLQIRGTTEMYNQFLLWNKQTSGIDSYNDVLLWAIAYPQKTIINN